MRLAALLVPLAVMACVDGARPFTRSTRNAVTRAKRVADERERRRIAALPRVPDGRYFSQSFVSAEAGVEHYLIGPLRAELRGSVVSVAEDVPEMPIVRAMRAARGWVFVTESGEVWSSPTFTGRLRALHTFDCRREVRRAPVDNLASVGANDDLGGLLPAPRPGDAQGSWGYPAIAVFESRGRIVIASPNRRGLFSTDGVTWSRVDIDDAVAMAWTSLTRGAVIVGESLRTTRDGGRTWNAIDLGAALPLVVEGRAQGLFVDTSEGMRRIGDDDSLTPAERVFDGPMRMSRTPNFARVFDRGYARATMTAPRCGELMQREDPRHDPSFALHIPERREEGGWTTWNLPRGVSAPLGTPRGRAFAPNERASAVVSIERPDNPSPGHPLTVSWRGEDSAGSFSGRITTAAPSDVSVESRWKVIAATRAGVAVRIDVDRSLEDISPPIEHRLYWLSGSGVRRVAITLFECTSFHGLALEDGSAAIVTRTSHEGDVPARSRLTMPGSPTVTCLTVIAPDGSTRGRRCVLERDQERTFAGVGALDGSIGLATIERPTDTALTLLTLDGASRPFDLWSVGRVPPVCGSPSSTRLHLFSLDDEFDVSDVAPFAIRIAPQFDGPPFAEAHFVTLERPPSSAAPCVRHVWGTRREESPQGSDDGDSDLWGAFRVTARNGRLIGSWDTGARLSTMPVTLDDDAPPEDL